jgi:carboxyl-terminal processing protease
MWRPWLTANPPTIGLSRSANKLVNRTALDSMKWLRPLPFPRRFTIGTDDGRQVPVDLNASYSQPERGLTLAKQVETVRSPDGLSVPDQYSPIVESSAISMI